MNTKNNNDKKAENAKEDIKLKPEAGDSKVPHEKGTVIVSKDDYEKLKEEARKASEYWDRLLRQQADFENSRKRLERDKQEFLKFAHEEIIADLLGILDDLERSVEAAEQGHENFDAFLKGIEMILAHLYELLKRKGVSPIDAKGKKFNPHEHEALMQTPTNEHEDEEVIEELQKGYKMGDRIIRTAKVRVAKKIQ